jgi:CheY-like chemotaxis protein
MAGVQSLRRPRRILLVDDDPDLRQSLAEALEEAGYSVERAANGQEALEVLRGSAERPSVILLDLLMPVMNGWQFCQLKQRDPAVATIPVIAMSAAVSKDPNSPYYIEVDDFLAKPVAFDDLVDKLERLTARPSPAAAG